MASKKIVIEVNSVESLMKSFATWRDMPHDKREKMIAEKGEGKRFSLAIPDAKKDGAYAVSFYSDGAVYVTFGRNKCIMLKSGNDPLRIYKYKDGRKLIDRLTWDCADYYSMDNQKLVKALSGSF